MRPRSAPSTNNYNALNESNLNVLKLMMNSSNEKKTKKFPELEHIGCDHKTQLLNSPNIHNLNEYASIRHLHWTRAHTNCKAFLISFIHSALSFIHFDYAPVIPSALNLHPHTAAAVAPLRQKYRK